MPTPASTIVNFIVYDDRSGKPLRDGRCAERDLILQAPPLSGETVVAVPPAAIVIRSVQLDPVKAMLIEQLDAAAMAIIVPGQKPIHARKLAEAQAGAGPLIEAEAEAMGVPVADVAAQIIAKAAEQDALEVRVEVARRQAKAAIQAAKNVGKAHQASQVDWDAVRADPAA